MRIILFKNWKHIIKQLYQTGPKFLFSPYVVAYNAEEEMEKSEPISFFFFFKSVSFPMFLIRHGIIQKIKLD